MNVCEHCKINDLEFCKKCPYVIKWIEVQR